MYLTDAQLFSEIRAASIAPTNHARLPAPAIALRQTS
jgi:hypothetical protein